MHRKLAVSGIETPRAAVQMASGYGSPKLHEVSSGVSLEN